jgi:hypothetical protein
MAKDTDLFVMGPYMFAQFSGFSFQVSGVKKKVSVFSVQVSGNSSRDLTSLA